MWTLILETLKNYIITVSYVLGNTALGSTIYPISPYMLENKANRRPVSAYNLFRFFT